MVGSREVGWYSVAVRMVEVWAFIPTAVYWSVFPGIVEARAASEELFYGRLQQFYNSMALAAYAIAIPVTFLAPWLVRTLYGSAYAPGGLMLAVLIWANLFTSLEMARSSLMMTMNWTRLYLVIVALGAAPERRPQLRSDSPLRRHGRRDRLAGFLLVRGPRLLFPVQAPAQNRSDADPGARLSQGLVKPELGIGKD